MNDWKEERGEDTDQKVVDMAQNCLNLNIQKSDIDRSHRVGKPNIWGRPRPVIVKFVSYRMKRAVYQARSALTMRGSESNAKFINEDLTKTRLRIYKDALSLKSQNLIQDCWTTDGNIFVRTMAAKVKMFDVFEKYISWSNQVRSNPPPSYCAIVQSEKASSEKRPGQSRGGQEDQKFSYSK